MEDSAKANVPAIYPIALGLISDPPTIVLTYDCVSQAKRKRRKRKMPLRDFTDRSNVKRYAFNLRQRHNKYLLGVVDVTLEKMLRIIQEIQKGYSVEASLKLVNKEYTVDPDEDLNVLSPAQLAQRKAVMEETFHKNLVRPGDPGFVYDKVVSFDDKKIDAQNDWDDDAEVEKEGQKEEMHQEVDNSSTADQENTIFKKHEIENNDNPPVQITELKKPDQSNDKDKEGEDYIDMKETQQIPSSESTTQPERDEPSETEFGITREKFPKTLLHTEHVIQNQNCANHDPESEDSINNFDGGLMNIESGVLDEEDEDFWQ